MPSTASSSSAWYSPWPASAAASERADSSTVATPANAKTISSASVRSSIASAPSITDVFSPHCHTPSPHAAPSVATERPGTSALRTKAGRSRPTISTRQAPAVRATSGEIAAQSIVGLFIARPPGCSP